MNVGVLASGSGTNLQALLDAGATGQLGAARVVVVGANVPGCGAVVRAQAVGVPTFVVDHRTFKSREEFDAAVVAALREHGCELVVLAGFMRILTPVFLEAFPQRIVNIHPSLLPAFPGVDAQGQAFRAGVKVAGCTVHFVEAGVDSGPVIAQVAVPVLGTDDAAALRARILAEEHKILPSVVRALSEGRVRAEGRRVHITPP